MISLLELSQRSYCVNTGISTLLLIRALLIKNILIPVYLLTDHIRFGKREARMYNILSFNVHNRLFIFIALLFQTQYRFLAYL